MSQDYLIKPDPKAPRLTRPVTGHNEHGQSVDIRVVEETAMTLYLNRQEIVTVMTIGDYPEYLAVGFLRNQNMLKPHEPVTEIDVDEDLGVIIVRTERETNYEDKLQKKVKTSGCAQGTVFGDLMDEFDKITLPQGTTLETAWIYALSRQINNTPSIYLEAGAIHGCILCQQDRPLVYMEDVGRHNAVDKIAGYMHLENMDAEDKILYTTGRLTSEMVIKTVQMGIPILISRSGFTAWGVELARQVGLTLIGRARGKRFVVLSGKDRLIYNADMSMEEDETSRHHRKGSA